MVLPLSLANGHLSTVHAQDNGAALTPLMGWSSWLFLRNNPTEAAVKARALAMSDGGLVAAGYKYVNIDDYYYLNPGTTVDANGLWVTDPAEFPDGMANLASYIHGLGEKFGMYLTPGIPVAAYNQNTPIQGTSFHAQDIVSNTSSYEANYNFGNGSMYYIDYAKNPAAAQAFLNSWADELAGYGIDYLKLDGVGDLDIPDIQHWSQALNQTGRTIHLELSNNPDPQVLGERRAVLYQTTGPPDRPADPPPHQSARLSRGRVIKDKRSLHAGNDARRTSAITPTRPGAPGRSEPRDRLGQPIKKGSDNHDRPA